MHRLTLLLLLLFAAPVFAAEGCVDVWFTRNLIMDRAGHCFSTPLGQAVFDNGDCTGGTVILDAPAQALVQRLRGLEAEHGCDIDTSARWLDMDDIAFRRVLRDLPVRMDGQWGCLGWVGTQVPLYDGYTDPLHAIGQILPGDYVLFEHLGPAENWGYVTVSAPGWGVFKSAGWLYWPETMPCAAEAG